jgi:hypothetical protein
VVVGLLLLQAVAGVATYSFYSLALPVLTAEKRRLRLSASLAHALELFFGLTFEINYQPSGSDPD